MHNAFISEVHREPTAHGPLSGTTFAIKDIFDLHGEVTGFGSPDWARTHAPAARTSPVVDALLAAGATLVGKTHMEELAFSLTGENAHYGTPINPAAPHRVPGGSSSGSAAAVAAGFIDFALGTDTGGSVRIPASFCGVFGIRTSYGALAVSGVTPLAPSFDTVGWFARDGAMLRRVGEVLIGAGPSTSPLRLVIAEDAFALAQDDRIRSWVPRLGAIPVEHEVLAPEGLEAWADAFRVLQGWEAWKQHGAWIEQTRPRLGPSIQRRFDAARKVTAAQAALADGVRARVGERLEAFLQGGGVLCLPTAPGPAPLRGESEHDSESFRARTQQLTCIAGLAGLPQVTLPAGLCDGAPVGISLIGAAGSDHMLLRAARLAA
ncbi:MAG: amidase [Deltaproteobacteria bacterium]|nr:amidase [Deltaproteobacteria bacterium]